MLAFLYADLIVLPLLDVYRRYYGWKMAAYIAALFYATMVRAAMVMELAFHRLGLVPARDPNIRAEMTHLRHRLHVLAQHRFRRACGLAFPGWRSIRLRLRQGSIVSIMPPKRTPVQNMAGTAATSFAGRLLIEAKFSWVRSERVAQSVHVLGGMPAGRRELARLAMPPMGALPLFDLRLTPVELLLALGELTA